jgi:transcription elongation factor GreA
MHCSSVSSPWRLEALRPDSEGIHLGQAISGYLGSLPEERKESASRELGRFARWLGVGVGLQQITAADVSRYQEQFPESSVDINGRLEPVKTFLTSLKAQRLTAVNLGAHIRLKRPSARRGTALAGRDEPEEVRITQEGYDALAEELRHLENKVRPEVTEQLRSAFADKDFRENAPYDAAKQRLAEVQGRIDKIRHILVAAAIITDVSTETVDLGTVVTLHSLQEDDRVTFTIVGPGEVNPRQGRISSQSPVGKALMERRVGEVVEVETPAGTHTFRIETINRRD